MLSKPKTRSVYNLHQLHTLHTRKGRSELFESNRETWEKAFNECFRPLIGHFILVVILLTLPRGGLVSRHVDTVHPSSTASQVFHCGFVVLEKSMKKINAKELSFFLYVNL